MLKTAKSSTLLFHVVNRYDIKMAVGRLYVITEFTKNMYLRSYISIYSDDDEFTNK